MILFYYKTILYLLIIILVLLSYVLFKNNKEEFIGNATTASSNTISLGMINKIKEILFKDPIIINAIERRLRLSKEDKESIENIKRDLKASPNNLSLKASIDERKSEFNRLKQKYERALVENDKFVPKLLKIDEINKIDLKNEFNINWDSNTKPDTLLRPFQTCSITGDKNKCNIYSDKNNEILKSVSQIFTKVNDSRYLSIYKAELPEKWVSQNKEIADNLYYIFNNINGSRKCLKFHSIDIFEFDDFKEINIKKSSSISCDINNTEQLFIKIEIGCDKENFEKCSNDDYINAINIYNHYISITDNIKEKTSEHFNILQLFKILKFNNKKMYILVPFNYPTYAITLKTNNKINEISIKPMGKDNRPFQQFIQIDPYEPKDIGEITEIMNKCPKL